MNELDDFEELKEADRAVEPAALKRFLWFKAFVRALAFMLPLRALGEHIAPLLGLWDGGEDAPSGFVHAAIVVLAVGSAYYLVVLSIVERWHPHKLRWSLRVGFAAFMALASFYLPQLANERIIIAACAATVLLDMRTVWKRRA